MLKSGGLVVVGVDGLVFGGGEHPERRVTASGVVPELDVVVDRRGQFDAGVRRRLRPCGTRTSLRGVYLAQPGPCKDEQRCYWVWGG